MKSDTSPKQKLLKKLFEEWACHIGSCLSCFEMIQAIYAVIKPGDKFILSKMHASKVIDVLGHIPEYVEQLHCYGGAIGNGIGIGIGMALALPNNKVYVIVGDGELNEGSIWEALFFNKYPSNLYVLFDMNKQQGNGYYNRQYENILTNLGAKYINGHNQSHIEYVLSMYQLIMCDTVKGHGIPELEGKIESHYHRMNEEEYNRWSGCV